MKRIESGVMVQWHTSKPRNGGVVRHRGMVVAFVPAGTNARTLICAVTGEESPRFAASATSSCDRYIVKVDKLIGRVGQPSHEYYAPQAKQIEQLNTLALK